jgi:hypothetical protein
MHEVVLTVSKRIGLTYHLNGSKIESLGNIYPGPFFSVVSPGNLFSRISTANL